MELVFGKRFKELRINKNLTQEKLAEFLGVSFQSISKWERGDNYPDITYLPVIARFFAVSVDYLLGYDEAVNEEEIKQKLYELDNSFDDEKREKILKELKEKYPGDFRVLLRLLGQYVFYADTADVDSEIISVYKNIQNNCTDDKIRICAKRYLIYYYIRQSNNPDSKICKEDYIRIIEEMPRMRDGQEQFSLFYYGDALKPKIRESVEEHIFLLENTLISCYYYNDDIAPQYKIGLVKNFLDFCDALYDDGNYSRMWPQVLYYHTNLAWLYYLTNDFEKSIEQLRTAVDKAKKLDSMEKITVMKSVIFKGEKFNKEEVFGTTTAKEQLKMWLSNKRQVYSKEYTSLIEYKDIMEFLNDGE